MCENANPDSRLARSVGQKAAANRHRSARLSDRGLFLTSAPVSFLLFLLKAGGTGLAKRKKELSAIESP